MPTHHPTLSGVLFDMDGTLLDSEKIWDVAIAELSSKVGRAITVEVRRSTLGNSLQDALAKVYRHAGAELTPNAFAESSRWVTARVDVLFSQGIPWRPGAQDALRLVRSIGLKAALVTNTERQLTDRALLTLGAEHFDATVTGDEVGRGKPAPDPYLRGASLLGLDPAQCLAVEDSPTGTASAAAAGCRVLVIPSEAAIEPGAGRTLRTSLVGLTAEDLLSAWQVSL